MFSRATSPKHGCPQAQQLIGMFCGGVSLRTMARLREILMTCDLELSRQHRRGAQGRQARRCRWVPTPDLRLSKGLLIVLPGCIVTDEIVQM